MPRMKTHIAAARTAVFVAVLFAATLPVLRAQNADDLMPAESAAKAQMILHQAVTDLGGPVYLNARNSDCTGRYASFEHSGSLGGYIRLHEYRELPDKRRVELDPKGRIVDLYAGKQGWTMDRGGVSDLPADVMADYQDQLQTDVNTILRYHLNDPTLLFRYAGPDVVDVTQVDWVEVIDRQGHTIRIAIGRLKHLPVRVLVRMRDPETGGPLERSTFYASYHLVDGIEVPYQVSRFRNDRQISQAFYEGCQFNTALPEDLFTRASLDAHYAAEHGNKK